MSLLYDIFVLYKEIINMKSRVFKSAWQIASNFKSFAEALKHAWELIKLKKAMLKGIVKFTYKRLDGSYVLQSEPYKTYKLNTRSN